MARFGGRVNRLHSRRIAAAVVAVVFLSTVVCAPAGAASVDSWSAAFCGGQTDNAHQLGDARDTANHTLSTANAANVAPTEVKAALVVYFNGIAQAMHEFHARMKKVGALDTARGPAIHRQVLWALSKMEQVAASDRDSAEQLDVSDPTSFHTGVSRLIGTDNGLGAILAPFQVSWYILQRLDRQQHHALRDQWAQHHEDCGKL